MTLSNVLKNQFFLQLIIKEKYQFSCNVDNFEKIQADCKAPWKEISKNSIERCRFQASGDI